MKGHLNKGYLFSLFLAMVANPLTAQDEFGFDDEPSRAKAPDRELTNYIELGAGIADGNGKIGEFSEALDNDGVFGVGSIFVTGAGESAGSLFYLDGEQGIYGSRLEAGYSLPGVETFEFRATGSQKVEMAEVMTVYPAGTETVLDLPADFGGSSDSGSYFRRDLTVDRRSVRLSLEKYIGPLLAEVAFSREDRNGERSLAGSQGFIGTAIAVEPVDYQHNELDLGLEYSDDRYAVGFNYHLSSFDNENRALVFENPNFIPIGREQLALAPGNEFSRLDLHGRFSPAERTSVMWLVNWSRAEQDESFLPYALNTNYYGGVFTPLPGDSLDGETERLNGRLTLVTRPLPRLNLKVEYSFRDRNARHDPFLLDSLSYSGSVTPLGAPAHTYGKERQKLELEAGYRFANRSRLRIGWISEDIDREREELQIAQAGIANTSAEDSTGEDRIWADYRIDAFDTLRLTFKLEHGDREADISQSRIEHLHFVSRDADGNLEAVGENTLPYYLSPRDQDIASVHGSLMLSESLALDGGFRLVDEEFNSDFDGLNERESRVVDLGLSFSPVRELSMSLYGSYETFQWQQDGTTSGGGGNVTALWTAEGDDDSLVVGANIQWTAIPNKLTLSGDLSFSDTESDLSSYNNLNGVAGNLPGYGSDVVRLDVEATWALAPETDLKLRYIYEDWRVSDFAWYDGEVIENIAFGWRPYDQEGHGIVLSARRRF